MGKYSKVSDTPRQTGNVPRRGRQTMKRRNFLVGVSGTAIGGSALLGSGAFTRVESQRRVKIQVANDRDAYLGLDGCPDSPNASYTNIDESGHLEIDMSPENPTEGGGEGVNSDSHTYFDDVFQICNQGKQKVGIWISEFETLEPEGDYGFGPENDRAVDFYLDGDDEDSLVGADNAFPLGVGQCVCVGLKTVTKGLVEEDQLIEDYEIVISADADNIGDFENRVEADSIQITGMCTRTTNDTEKALWRVYNENPFPVNVDYEVNGLAGSFGVPANVTRGDGDEPWIPGYYILTEHDEPPELVQLFVDGELVDQTGIDPEKECEPFEDDLIDYIQATGEPVLVEDEDDIPQLNA